MVAVVLVILDHLFGWPRGGFIGVDVFFVISGFLITGILLRDAEKIGHVSFVEFYRRRLRRIVPAATLTLAAIAVAAALIFTGPRASSTWWDSIAAFFFVSNWRFAVEGTDYFTAAGPISPVRHFWSLSVEEQFYFVWPVVIALIVLLAGRKALSASTRRAIIGASMGALVATSFTWALINTGSNPTWSYFSTLTRVWELGVGALIAIFATSMARIPDVIRPALAWAGLAIIAFGAGWITEDIGFPGPWAVVPVAGSALVIIAGTGATKPVRFLQPITNPLSVKVGDLSYSLYLWHWPVIIFLGVYVDPGWQFYVAALGLMAALSTLAYYYVEQPILASSWLKPRESQEWRRIPHGHPRRVRQNLAARFTFQMNHSRQLGAVTGIGFLAVGLVALAMVQREVPVYISSAAVDEPAAELAEQQLPPAVAALQEQLKAAVKADSWPVLTPSMEAVIAGPRIAPDMERCVRDADSECWFGNQSAPRTMVLVGDSIGMAYLPIFRAFVEASGGQWRLLNQTFNGCPFNSIVLRNVDDATNGCPPHNRLAVGHINRLRPDLVVISNTYTTPLIADTQQDITVAQWQSSVRDSINEIPGSHVILLTAPPFDKEPAECFQPEGLPSRCVGRISRDHRERVNAETELATAVGGELLDTRLLFCTQSEYCPMFAGTTPMKVDRLHMSPEYAALITPAFSEMLRGTRLFAGPP